MGVQDQFVRPLRVGVAPFTTVILFAILLAYFFVLYQPGRGPGSIQGIGRQAYEVVFQGAASQLPDTDEFGLPLTAQPKPAGTQPATPSNWWEVPTPTDAIEEASLPMDMWKPLLPQSAGLSEITVQRCMFPPDIVQLCAPKSNWEDSWRNGGSWVRVGPDLNQKSGFWYLNLYYRRTRRQDVPLITNITLLAQGDEATLEDKAAWKKVETSVRDGVRGVPPLYLWYKVGPKLQDYKEKNATSHLITELDVSYGDSPAWYGFEKLPVAVFPGNDKVDPVWLTYRRGPAKPVPQSYPLHFSAEKNGTYKILQVADLHFSTGRGLCRDTTVSPCLDADAMTTTLLAKALDSENPDLVVFTGDQLNGQRTSWNSKSVLTEFAKEVIRRRIPWAVVLGNHDDEDDLSRKELMDHISRMPFSVASSGPEDVDGAGNYVLKIKSPDPSATHILTLYFLDSHGYITADYGLFKQIVDYDYIHQRQIDWFLAESQQIKYIVRPFRPDGAHDTGNITSRVKAGAGQKLAKPNALMFYHIPIPETFNSADVDSHGKPLLVGNQFDADGGSKKNDGFFKKAILSAPEGSQPIPEVKVIGNGHDHITDFCKRVQGVWFCFGGGGSYAAYGRLGFDRRYRVYEISDWGETIRSYKRTEFDEIIDDVVLVGKGAMGSS
ncbi:Metallo-dependent phosphatase [Auriculariales sp. MPI-PUGE-AT-0066]|nr:Metallo-dependent phosphatase [Auriculariales sp. MPI-PUGE-AT-0066]